MGYDELYEHYVSLNKESIEKYNNSYEKYLDEHKRNIGDKFPPIPESMFESNKLYKNIQKEKCFETNL